MTTGRLGDAPVPGRDSLQDAAATASTSRPMTTTATTAPACEPRATGTGGVVPPRSGPASAAGTASAAGQASAPGNASAATVATAGAAIARVAGSGACPTSGVIVSSLRLTRLTTTTVAMSAMAYRPNRTIPPTASWRTPSNVSPREPNATSSAAVEANEHVS